MAQMDAGMGNGEGRGAAQRQGGATGCEIFLPKIDGSTTTIAHLLQHLAALCVRAMLLGPESGMREYARATLFGTFGVPLRVIRLVDPIWLGVQALFAPQIAFPSTPIVMNHHTNLPTYAEIFGYTLVPLRLASNARKAGDPEGGGKRRRSGGVFVFPLSLSRTLPPSPHYSHSPTLSLSKLHGRGIWMRACAKLGVDALLCPTPAVVGAFLGRLHGRWLICGCSVSMGRVVSLGFTLTPRFRPLPTLTENSISETRFTTKLVFVGDAPYLSTLQRLCAQLGVEAIFMGQLTGRRRLGVRML
ncbi:hypothetical protein B0H13DRAFT_2653604 [Mycena leptocephala]|nr:hypothetical protein B0H13DRAFT_2653604 [Mycena leptocephala]